jgi:hypothetical protein
MQSCKSPPKEFEIGKITETVKIFVSKGEIQVKNKGTCSGSNRI